MAISYTSIIYTSTGVAQSYSDGFLDIVITRAVNGIDMLRIIYDGSSDAVPYCTYGSIIEVWREDNSVNIAYYREFAGIIRYIETVIGDATLVTVQAVGFNALLADRIVAWPAGVANRSAFSAVPAETALKLLFEYNVGANATVANGRLVNGVISGTTAYSTTGEGNLISIAVHGQNLLTAMQRIQENAGGDFALVFTAPSTFDFQWHSGQLGNDRASSVVFNVGNGTIGQLRIITDRITDTTATIVGGQGEGVLRQYVTRPTALPTGLDLRERFVDARSQTTTAQYQQAGDIVLAEAERQRGRVEAQILQSDALRYGRDYFFGDIVSVYDGTAMLTRKIQSIGLHFASDGSEAIDVGLITT